MGVGTQAVGLVFALGIAIGSGEPFPTPVGAAWSLIAGSAGVIGLLAFYRGLAVGAMSLVAPLAALIGAGLPVVAGYALGERLAPGQGAGIVAALAAVALVSRPAGDGEEGRGGLGLAFLAGLGFAAFFVGMDRAVAAGAGSWWPLPIARTASVVLTSGAVAVAGRGRQLRGVMTPIVLVAGIADTAGNLGFLLARSQGSLGPAAVVSSLYPAVTVVFAWFLLDERLGKVHVAGVALAFAGIALIALPG